ncbi:hypothetical protein NDU88_012376 [Pleurodeles waltl]|uniref:Uncharacterized protein n=1 Tax=Pleurodeles waltl TaxID=8319 RepID=A0AAV7R1R4_PLEWA|nr:hypothetical protein NDU88_012376 [Pleurodeles waltl]
MPNEAHCLEMPRQMHSACLTLSGQPTIAQGCQLRVESLRRFKALDPARLWFLHNPRKAHPEGVIHITRPTLPRCVTTPGAGTGFGTASPGRRRAAQGCEVRSAGCGPDSGLMQSARVPMYKRMYVRACL